MELNFKHSLIRELGKRSGDIDEITGLPEFLYDVALLDGSDPDDPRRAEACERSQDLMQRLSAGEDTGADDLPPLGPVDLPAVAGSALGGGGPGDKKDVALLSCGSMVRVVKGDRARRAIISFVDDDTVDVMYSLPGGREEEEEGVPVKAVQKLLDFETDAAAKSVEAASFKENFFKACSNAKEQGNQLFKLKDYDAASERYTTAINAFASRPASRGQEVLVVSQNGGKPELATTTLATCDAEGSCELSNGMEVSASAILPVVSELLPLHTSLYMNRARCRQNSGLHKEAAQDLTMVLCLWRAANKRMLEADAEMKEAESKGLYTAEYLRARSRLARGLAKQAAADVRSALGRNPPVATAKQLRQLKEEVQAAQEKHKQVNGPLAKELAKVVIALRGGPKIS